MDDNMTIGLTRATAIAAVNAVVKHLELGLFVAEYRELGNFPIRSNKPAGYTNVSIKGRVNTGSLIFTSNYVFFQTDRNATFPIEKVIVSIHDPDREGYADEHLYFECTFGDDFVIKKLKEAPF